MLHHSFDIPHTIEVLGSIRNGLIDLVRSNRLSPMSIEGLDEPTSMTLPDRADYGILKALKERLLNNPIVLVCIHCGNNHYMMASEFPHDSSFRCSMCNGVFLAMLHERKKWQSELLSKKKQELEPEEKRIVERLDVNASLVQNYGKRAVIALCARGVGPVKAAAILKRPYRQELDFLREVLKAEIEYARTRRFWD